MIKRPCHVHNNQKGLATIEALPLVVVFVVLITYGLGLFGFVHTAILHSIGARTYAFETFRNRTNVSFFEIKDGVTCSTTHPQVTAFMLWCRRPT